MGTTLVGQLAEGPLDIIGDVHGERAALETLVAKLGYCATGRHPQARRLVLVGDLCDRGPDSPGVIRLVQSWVEAGRAQVVAGNHELNLLRRERKHGNHWFYGRSDDPEFGHCVAVSEAEQEPILSFLRSLPVALEREDLRVVHAAWMDAGIERCRSVKGPLDEAYQAFEMQLERRPEYQRLKRAHDEALRDLGKALNDPSSTPHSEAIGPFEEYCQMGNPLRVLTSGVERCNAQPFFASGKWRFVDRVPWWREYDEATPVIFGHYWRWWDPSVHAALSKGEPQLFADDPKGPTMDPEDHAFCIDFSVGSRYKQRRLNQDPPYHGRLAAIRWPERELVFDDMVLKSSG